VNVVRPGVGRFGGWQQAGSPGGEVTGEGGDVWVVREGEHSKVR